MQNELVPGLNRLEGVNVQGDYVAIVSSQPRFDLVPVTLAEIDEWFQSLGFEKITACGYYRAEDNLGVFDAHSPRLISTDQAGEMGIVYSIALFTTAAGGSARPTGGWGSNGLAHIAGGFTKSARDGE